VFGQSYKEKIKHILFPLRRDSVVGMATGYGLDDQAIPVTGREGP
jgi:hypothetical protein